MKEFRQGLTERGYFREEEMAFSQCDCRERLRMAALLSQAACYAGYDYDARGMTRAKMLEQGCAFLLSRIALRVQRWPRYGETLTMETWENGVKGAHMQRAYELRDRDTGELRVSIRGDWVLVDPKTHKILRPRSLVQETVTPVEFDCPQTKKLLLPDEGAEEWGVRRVMWSDLDGNGHLFSGRYGDIIWDALPEDLREREVAEFYLNYRKEAVLGQELRLRGVRKENSCWVEGGGPESVCFTALCVY